MLRIEHNILLRRLNTTIKAFRHVICTENDEQTDEHF